MMTLFKVLGAADIFISLQPVKWLFLLRFLDGCRAYHLPVTVTTCRLCLRLSYNYTAVCILFLKPNHALEISPSGIVICERRYINTLKEILCILFYSV